MTFEALFDALVEAGRRSSVAIPLGGAAQVACCRFRRREAVSHGDSNSAHRDPAPGETGEPEAVEVVSQRAPQTQMIEALADFKALLATVDERALLQPNPVRGRGRESVCGVREDVTPSQSRS